MCKIVQKFNNYSVIKYFVKQISTCVRMFPSLYIPFIIFDERGSAQCLFREIQLKSKCMKHTKYRNSFFYPVYIFIFSPQLPLSHSFLHVVSVHAIITAILWTQSQRSMITLAYAKYMSGCFVRISRSQSHWIIQSTRNGGHARVRMYSTYVSWRKGRAGSGGEVTFATRDIPPPVCGWSCVHMRIRHWGKQGQRVACE